MYKDKFVLSIIHEGYPVKEFGSWSEKRVALPFDSEYKIRLKNKNSKGCTARVFIDDRQVSKLGDLIISANGTIDLERFIDSSLKGGSKFKFVPLDHSDVDDPTSSENGIIKVEFRLARKKNDIEINIEPFTYKPWNWDDWRFPGFYSPWNFTTGGDIVHNYKSDLHSDDSYNGSVKTSFSSDAVFVSDNIINTNLEDGATIEGGHSNQSFVYSNLDVEDAPTILQLKIVGINKNVVEPLRSDRGYCTKCGHRLHQNDRYCGVCGKKL